MQQRAAHDAPASAPASRVSALAAEVKGLLAAGDDVAARERYGDLVGDLQRRASRVAYGYLRDGADADEAVQDAFVRAYTALPDYREDQAFEAWFTRILVNGCLDRLKARGRRARWLRPMPDAEGRPWDPPSGDPSPEARLVGREAVQAVREVIDTLPERQRQVLLLSHVEGWSSREISELTGIRESTVRVHLHRAVHRLRRVLAGRESGALADRATERARA